MASPQPNDDPRLSTYSKDEASTRDQSPARLATDAAMAEKKPGSDCSEPSPVDALAAAAPTDDPAAVAQSAGGGGAALAKQPSKEVLERSLLKTATLMFALCMAVFLAALDITIITTALPTISEHFGSAAGFTWIGSAYLLGAASSTPIWAKFSDIFGRKPILMSANVVFFVGSLVAALAKSIGMLIAARAVQGIGGGGLITLVSVSIGDLFSMRVRGMYYGMVGFVWAVASACGPLLGGVFTQKVTWRWCFYINIPFQAITLVILGLLFNVHTPKTQLLAGLAAIDWSGSILIVGGIIMFLLGLQFGGATHPWDSPIVICLIVFGVTAIGLFAINEARIARYPIIPLHIFRHRSNIAVLATCFCHGFVFIGGSFYLPFFFQAVLGHGPIISGVLLLANVLPLSILSICSGMFIRKTGQYLPPIWFGMAMQAIGFGLFINLGANPSLGKIIGFQVIAGIGTGPNFQAPLIALQSLVPPRDIAAAVATFQLSRNIATSMSVVIGAVVFQNALSRRLPQLAAVDPAAAARLGGFNAAASAGLIKTLPAQARAVARDIFTQSLRDMWIMYTAFAVLGLLLSMGITKQRLDHKHQVTKTGLETEELKRKEREDERRTRRESKRESKRVSGLSGGTDLEKGNAEPAK